MHSAIKERYRKRLFRYSSKWQAWRARRAVERLGRLLGRDDADAAALLAEVVAAGRHPYADRAMRCLANHMASPAGVVVVRMWAESRAPRLAELLATSGVPSGAPAEAAVVAGLKFGGPTALEDAGPESAPALRVALRDPDPEVAGNARAVLIATRNQDLIDAVAAAWAEQRDELIADVLLQGGHVASKPVQVRVLTALLGGGIGALDTMGADAVAHLTAATGDPDLRIQQSAHYALRRLSDPAAQAEVCRQALAGTKEAKAAAIDAGYLPSDERERALFLFLTEQWQRYGELDFDGRLLSAAYQSVGAELQARVRGVLRASGRADALRVLLGGDRRQRVRTMTRDGAEFLISSLERAGAWPRLWSLVFELPFASALEIVLRLDKMGWQPDRPDDSAVFDRLRHAVANGVNHQAHDIGRYLPVAVHRATANFDGRVNGLAFAPDAPHLAIASNRRRVGLWDLQGGRLLSLHDGFDASVGEIVHLGGGILVAAERTNSTDKPCQVVAIEGRHRRRVGIHTGSVTGLVAWDGGVLTSGRDHTLAVWDLHRPGRVNQVRLETWPRSVKSADDGARVACVHDGVSVVDVPQARLTARSGLWNRVARDAAFAPASGDLVVGMNNGSVLVCTIHRAGIREFATLRSHERVEAVESVPSRAIVLTGGAEGVVHVYRWPNRMLIGSLQAPGGRLTSVTVSPTGDFLATGTSDHEASLWDLRVADVPALFAMPLVDATPSHLAVLTTLDGATLPAEVRPLIETMRTMLRYRFRHDIEIDDLVEIRAGRFDIELG
jgi:hypothetical protein